MQLKTIQILKRKTTRPVMVPDYGENSYREIAWAPKMFRFRAETTEYVSGQLRIVFDLSGKPIEGWSYYTCIFCYTEPSADYPQGRLIYNASGYGSTTGKHIYAMREFFSAPHGSYTGDVQSVSYKRVQAHVRTVEHEAYTYENCEGESVTQPAWTHNVTRDTKGYTSEVTRKPIDADSLTCDQVCWGRGASPHEMRGEAATGYHSRALAERNAAWREQSAAWAAERDARAAASRAEAHAAGLADGSVIALKAVI